MVEVSNYFVKCIAVYIPGKQVYIKIKVKTNIANTKYILIFYSICNKTWYRKYNFIINIFFK